MRVLRVLLPWLVGAAILAVLIDRVPPDELRAALAAGDARIYAPVAAVFVAIWLAIDARVLAALFSRVAGPLSWLEMMRIRGATYPLLVVSFHLSNVQLVAALRRATGAPLPRLAGGMLLHYLVDLTALALLACAASFASGEALALLLRPTLAAVALALVALLLLGRGGRGLLRDRPVVGVLSELPLRVLLALVGGRALFHASLVAFVYLSLPAFGLHVSLVDVLIRMPLVLAVAALPLTPAGLGTAQAMLLLLFRDFGSEAQLLSFGLYYAATLIGLRLPLGALLWLCGRVQRPACHVEVPS